MLSWNEQGLISPIGASATSRDRSPYRISLIDFYKHFSKISSDRKALLDGLILFRQELHKLEITKGFQWINGSFLENIEKTEGRPPNDIDSVIFIEEFNVEKIFEMQNFLKDKDSLKKKFKIDSYHEWICELPLKDIVRTTTYWYSMWSHTRDHQWKGFVEIDLNPDEDIQLLNYLKGDNYEH